MKIESIDFMLTTSLPSKLTLTFSLNENVDLKTIQDITQKKIYDLICSFGYQIQSTHIQINSLVDLTDEGDPYHSYVCISEVTTM